MRHGFDWGALITGFVSYVNVLLLLLLLLLVRYICIQARLARLVCEITSAARRKFRSKSTNQWELRIAECGDWTLRPCTQKQ